MLNFEVGVGCTQNSQGCQGASACDSSPDFCIKRGDTRPSFKVSVEDCDGVVDLTDENLVLEASMWFKSKLKSAISSSDATISFADNIGFDQVSVGDLIILDRPRSAEQMLVLSIDETAKTIHVQRAHNSTLASDWPKGNLLRVFKFIDLPAKIESVFEEVSSLDGSTSEQLVDTFMVLDWEPSHTSLPGCYLLEYRLTMLDGSSISWTKKTPLSKEGFVVRIVDSPTNS